MSSLVDVNQRIKHGNEGELGEPLVHIIHELSAAIADPALPLQQTLQRGLSCLDRIFHSLSGALRLLAYAGWDSAGRFSK